MGEPRAKTLQERMGFRDTDLASPGHDALMLWLSDPADESGLSRAADAAWQLYKRATPKRTVDAIRNDVLSLLSRNYETRKRELAESVPVPDPPVSPDARKFRQKACVWERPVMSGSYTVGFIDILVELEIGAIDLLWNDRKDVWEWAEFPERKSYAFEVKPTIPSLGALIRQVRLYETYCRDVHFVIVSPDARFRTTLEAQGIGFVEVPPTVWDELTETPQ